MYNNSFLGKALDDFTLTEQYTKLLAC